jgi:hypothetical protein
LTEFNGSQSQGMGDVEVNKKMVLFILGLFISGSLTRYAVSQTENKDVLSLISKTENDLRKYSIFWNDKNNQVLLIDPNHGQLKIFNSKGKMIQEQYFSDQNPDHSPEIFKQVPRCDVIGGCCESGEGRYNKAYIAITRNQDCAMPQDTKNKLFKNELTLLNLAGETLFQNREPDSVTGVPLKVFADLQVIVVGPGEDDYGAINSGHYYGLDFQGKKIWEYHGGLIFDRGDLIAGGIKNGFLKLVDHQIHPMTEGMNLKPGDAIPIGEEVRDVPTGKELNLKTGEVSLAN